MKQAIEEGFILDVLTNYTTYQGYYEVIKSIKENPKYNNKKAQKRYVRPWSATRRLFWQRLKS